jgi:hypothetical protein
MRVNVANYQAMNVQDKKLAWEELNFISDLSMVVLGAVAAQIPEPELRTPSKQPNPEPRTNSPNKQPDPGWA